MMATAVMARLIDSSLPPAIVQTGRAVVVYYIIVAMVEIFAPGICSRHSTNGSGMQF